MQIQFIEYMGVLLPDDHLSAPPDILDQIEPEKKLKIRIEHCLAPSEDWKELLRENSMLVAADQDWPDWAHPVEDIYEEYRQNVI